jgi:hypothetical protein
MMAERALDFLVFRGGSKQEEISVHADPANVDALQKVLRGWLEGNKWARPLWKDFSAEVRDKGKYKLLARVRA